MRTLIVAAALLTACDGRIFAPGTSLSSPDLPPPMPGPGPGPMMLDCSARHPATADLRRLTVHQYQNAIADIYQGQVQPSAAYPGAYGTSSSGFSTEPGLYAVGEQGATDLMTAAEDVALNVATALPQLLSCSSGATCFGTYLDTFGRRAFRRALTGDERASLQTTFDAATADGASFAEATAIATAQVLQSPQFLYAVEGASGSGRALTGDELASRLAFMLWDSVPDDALLDAAPMLTDSTQLAAQAQRMLASPKADTALARLLREWTQTSALTASDKDSTAFPFFTASYAASLNTSFDRFAAEQLRSGTLGSLLTSAEAYVDANLAPSYGVTAPPAGQWQKVALDATRYSGVGTQGLVLASDAHPTESSFVFRGRFVRKRMLCDAFGAPPANAQATLAMIPLPMNPTGKEVSAAIVSNATCAACHSLMNPAGLSLEHFDGAGRWRDTYASGRAIDPSGTMPQVDGQAVTFTSQIDLFAQLAPSHALASCTARQMFRYTFSRLETDADACSVQAVQQALDASGGDLSKALLAVVSTDAFSWRADP
jgi:hypothetical protein